MDSDVFGVRIGNRGGVYAARVRNGLEQGGGEGKGEIVCRREQLLVLVKAAIEVAAAMGVAQSITLVATPCFAVAVPFG